MRGHAIEVPHQRRGSGAATSCRFPGTVGDLRMPGGPGVRFDTMLYAGYAVPPFYDSLLGKLIVWDENRDACAGAAASARSTSSQIGGLKTTTTALHQALAADADVRAAQVPYALAGALARNAMPSRLASDRERWRRHETGIRFGGDEHIFVEVDEEMSLEAFFKSLSITNAVRERKIKGVTEICPANASFQIKFDPDVIAPDDMLAEIKSARSSAREGRTGAQDAHHRDPGLLQRSLDARDADALPRAPPGSEVDRHRICRAHQ